MLGMIPIKKSIRMFFILFFVVDCVLLSLFLLFPAWIGLKVVFVLYLIGAGIVVRRFLGSALTYDPVEGSIWYRKQGYRYEQIRLSEKRFGNHLLFMVRLRDDKKVHLSLKSYDFERIKEVFLL